MGILERLGAESFAEREAATKILLQDPAMTLEKLVRMYDRATTLEQRHRLLDVGRHLALQDLARRGGPGSTADASVGIAHQVLSAREARLDRPAVLVRQTLPGFPGYAYLEPGDLIVAVEGQALPRDADEAMFVQMVRQQRPGAQIRFTVLREGERRLVSMPLASADTLAAIYARSGTELAEPYRTICRRIRVALLAGDAIDLDRLAQRN